MFIQYIPVGVSNFLDREIKNAAHVQSELIRIINNSYFSYAVQHRICISVSNIIFAINISIETKIDNLELLGLVV